MFSIVALFLYFIQFTSGDWVAEWMSPIQEQIRENPARRSNMEYGPPAFDEDNVRMVRVMEDVTEAAQTNNNNLMVEGFSTPILAKNELTTSSLKAKLENTLQNAKMLAETLKVQIKEVSARENMLKEAIVNGRSGVSTVLVSVMDKPPRTYIVRDGVWTLCRGAIHAPQLAPAGSGYSEHLAEPKCIGQELSSVQDPCVFNSIIKYETVPTVRRLIYSEDDILCLKPSFNSTLERYMSVPRQIINDTCQNGIVRSLEDNVAKCGVRVMSEYTFYPVRGYGFGLPLEYCTEQDGSCKLIVAWHVSNSSIENFEFLKNEIGFKKYFIKTGGYLEHVI